MDSSTGHARRRRVAGLHKATSATTVTAALAAHQCHHETQIQETEASERAGGCNRAQTRRAEDVGGGQNGDQVGRRAWGRVDGGPGVRVDEGAVMAFGAGVQLGSS